MPRNGPVFVSSKQVNTYASPKSVPKAQRPVQPVRNNKPASRKEVAPPESPAQCLQRLIKEVPADKQLIVALRLYTVITINRAVLEAEQQQDQQWAWLSAYEASREQHWQELEWVDMLAKQSDEACSNQSNEEAPLPATEESKAQLECSDSEPIMMTNCTPEVSEQLSSKVTPAAVKTPFPITLTVFTYEQEDMPTAADEVQVAQAACNGDGYNATAAAVTGAVVADCYSSLGGSVYNMTVFALTSVFITMHLIRVAAYCTLAFTCYTAAAVDVALCTLADAEVTAVAVASCKKLSRCMSSSFKRLAFSDSGFDASMLTPQ